MDCPLICAVAFRLKKVPFSSNLLNLRNNFVSKFKNGEICRWIWKLTSCLNRTSGVTRNKTKLSIAPRRLIGEFLLLVFIFLYFFIHLFIFESFSECSRKTLSWRRKSQRWSCKRLGYSSPSLWDKFRRFAILCKISGKKHVFILIN